MNNNVVLNIEEQERLINNCGMCSIKLTAENKSGWFAFYGTTGEIQIESCIHCHKLLELLNRTIIKNTN